MNAPSGADVVVDDVSKSFGRIAALRGVSLRLKPGEAVAMAGRSGSGKSTLLALIGGLERPDTGRVLIDGQPIWAQPRPARARREVVGFVFQRHLLLGALSARANVEVPLIGAGAHRAARHERAMSLLEEVGLADRAEHLPSELSGGERQRVAVARALANDPPIVLADEPTGSLDSKASGQVFDVLNALVAEHGKTVVAVTHDMGLAERMHRHVELLDGRIVADEIHARA